MKWVRSETGSALHRPSCASIETQPSTVTLTRAAAALWLSQGDRRFLCRSCCPSDPRLRVLDGAGEGPRAPWATR